MRRKTEHFIQRFLAHELTRHPFMVPAVTLVLLSIVTLFCIIWFGSQTRGAGEPHTVQLTVAGQKETIPTRAVNVRDLLKRLDIELHEGDVVEPALDTRITSDEFRVNVYRAKPVTIIDGDERIQAFSAATTPRSIAAQAGVNVFPEDAIEYADAQDAIREQVLGANLIIDRATPVQFFLYGTSTTVRTHATTVGDLLTEKGIVLAATDTVSPAANTPIKRDIEIQINRQGTKTATETEEIAFEIEYIDDDSLSFGTIAVRQEGSPGSKLITYQIELENSVEVGRKKVQELINKQPVKRIVARGKAISIPADRTQIMASAGMTPDEYPYAQYIINHENGLWCPTRWQGQFHCPPYYEPIHSPNDPSIGYGLCQSTPANKMATFGEDWKTNVVTQMKWCDDYAIRRYGSWAGAYEFWTANRWW